MFIEVVEEVEGGLVVITLVVVERGKDKGVVEDEVFAVETIVGDEVVERERVDEEVELILVAGKNVKSVSSGIGRVVFSIKFWEIKVV